MNLMKMNEIGLAQTILQPENIFAIYRELKKLKTGKRA